MMTPELPEVRAAIRSIPDFPVPGILFRDITPVLQDPRLFQQTVEALTAYARRRGAEVIAGVESRGFMFGAPVALAMGLPFVPVRKKGKLPADTESVEYALEYGTAEIEIHKDAVRPGQRVLVLDDLLATGGTAAAAVELVEKIGGTVAGIAFVIELVGLRGREKLAGRDVAAFVRYE